jgi:hypothetical protein
MSKVELSEPSRQRRKSQVNHFSHYEYIDICLIYFNVCNVYEYLFEVSIIHLYCTYLRLN